MREKGLGLTRPGAGRRRELQERGREVGGGGGGRGGRRGKGKRRGQGKHKYTNTLIQVYTNIDTTILIRVINLRITALQVSGG